MSEQNRLEINWPNALGGALAAVSAAVLLSTLGTAGTLIGAALGSLLITIGGAVYSHSMRVAHERLLARRAMLARISAHRGAAGSRTRRIESHDDDAMAKESRVQLLRALPWKRIAAVSVALFAVAMAVIVAFELSTGRTVSSYTGGTGDTDSGTSVPGIGGREEEPVPEPEAPGQRDDPPPAQDEDPGGEEPDPALPPEQEPTPTEGTVEPSPGDSPTQTPTEVPTTTP